MSTGTAKSDPAWARRLLAGWMLLGWMLLVGGCGGGEPSYAPSNILLVTVDTLRADHLSAWGYPRPTSPAIDALAAQGVRFDQAWAQWPKTGPSFASLFTATYPKDNGIVRRIGTPLPAGFLMLAETLQRRGYATHAVVSNGALGSDYFFDQGFDSYVETWKLAPPGDAAADVAEVVNREALRVVDGLDSDKPFFLWVHYIDPHFPYRPPTRWLEPFLEDSVYEPIQEISVARTENGRQIGGIGLERKLDDRTDLGYYVALYDAEIAYTDHQLGLLLAEMGTRGLMENTLTVFTADHGESLGEHGYFFDHGRFGFETCLHVPLIFSLPGRIAPRVDRAPAELLDVAPTILEFAGVPLADGEWMQGRSLLPRLNGEADDEVGYSHSEAGYATEGRWQKIVRDQRHKLIFVPFSRAQRTVGGLGQKFALFDLMADPGETANLVTSEREVFDRLKSEMWTWWKPDSFEVLVDVNDTREEKEVATETIEQLKALGYLQ